MMEHFGYNVGLAYLHGSPYEISHYCEACSGLPLLYNIYKVTIYLILQILLTFEKLSFSE